MRFTALRALPLVVALVCGLLAAFRPEADPAPPLKLEKGDHLCVIGNTLDLHGVTFKEGAVNAGMVFQLFIADLLAGTVQGKTYLATLKEGTGDLDPNLYRRRLDEMLCLFLTESAADTPGKPQGYEETGSVSSAFPGIGFSAHSSNAANHTYEMTADNFTEKGHSAFLIDAKVEAAVLLDFLTNPQFRQTVQTEQKTMAALFSLEVCDPVECDTYDIGDISVCNFVLPTWFLTGPHPDDVLVDFLGRLAEPFTLSPGGYASYCTELGRWQQWFARRCAKQHRHPGA